VVAEEASALGDETIGTGAAVEDVDATKEEEGANVNVAWVSNPHLMCIWQQPYVDVAAVEFPIRICCSFH
jgi:hypothetical protein